MYFATGCKNNVTFPSVLLERYFLILFSSVLFRTKFLVSKNRFIQIFLLSLNIDYALLSKKLMAKSFCSLKLLKRHKKLSLHLDWLKRPVSVRKGYNTILTCLSWSK